MPEFEFINKAQTGILKLKAQLNNPEKILKQIGAMGAKSARQAFEDQGLGEFKWRERYPGQSSPKLNIAGALQDFLAGRPKPKDSRLRDKPALMDTGDLRNRMSFRLTGTYEVEWGTTQEYAAIHNWGSAVMGPSIQAITEDAKKKIAEYLFTPRTNPYHAGMVLGKMEE